MPKASASRTVVPRGVVPRSPQPAAYQSGNLPSMFAAPRDAAAWQKAAGLLGKPVCTDEDFACAVLARCIHHVGDDPDISPGPAFNTCINDRTQRLAKERQQIYVASFDVEGEDVRVYLSKLIGTDDRYGDWCGENLVGKIEYPQEYRVLPSLARTVGEIVNASVSQHCPEAKFIQFDIHTWSTRIGVRQTHFSTHYLQAYRDGEIWNINLHPKYVESLEAQARLSALWSMVSNPTELGHAVGMAQFNEAASRSLMSRYGRYAREGKVCTMRPAVRHCYVTTTWTTGYGGSIGRTMIINSTPTTWSSCPDPCKNHNGYCNMETGARYPTAEAAERANCRSATQAEIDRAIARIQVDSSVRAYPYRLHYSPWYEFFKRN